VLIVARCCTSLTTRSEVDATLSLISMSGKLSEVQNYLPSGQSYNSRAMPLLNDIYRHQEFERTCEGEKAGTAA